MANMHNGRRTLQFNLKTLVGLVVLFALSFAAPIRYGVIPFCLICSLVGAQISRSRPNCSTKWWTILGGGFGAAAFCLVFELLVLSGAASSGLELIVWLAFCVGSLVGSIAWKVLDVCGHFSS